jgi:hypothetical protein
MAKRPSDFQFFPKGLADLLEKVSQLCGAQAEPRDTAAKTARPLEHVPTSPRLI